MTDSISHGFSVGDEVVLVTQYRGRKNTVVTKVGRKYFWVKDSHHYQKFYLDSGREVSNYGSADYVTTPERDAERQRRTELSAQLREHGVVINGKPWSSQKLTRLLAAVTEDDGAV